VAAVLAEVMHQILRLLLELQTLVVVAGLLGQIY
jgi:hypothetical protein